jgi:hypothetical protein
MKNVINKMFGFIVGALILQSTIVLGQDNKAWGTTPLCVSSDKILENSVKTDHTSWTYENRTIDFLGVITAIRDANSRPGFYLKQDNNWCWVPSFAVVNGYFPDRVVEYSKTEPSKVKLIYKNGLNSTEERTEVFSLDLNGVIPAGQ